MSFAIGIKVNGGFIILNEYILFVTGPTASGKSSLALSIASSIDAEIVNADSQQVYKKLNICTAKPTADDISKVRHHLVDIVNPDSDFSAALFQEFADKAIADIAYRGKKAIVVGGTGLYIKALLNGIVDAPSGAGEIRCRLELQAKEIGSAAMHKILQSIDPLAASNIHPNNVVRVIRALEVYYLTGEPISIYQQAHQFSKPRYRALKIALKMPRDILYERIDKRVDKMIEDGLVAEVKSLIDEGLSPDAKSLDAIGCREVLRMFAGEYDEAEMIRLIKRNTRRYAKRQLTWFNADKDIIWFDYLEKFDTILSHVVNFFAKRGIENG